MIAAKAGTFRGIIREVNHGAMCRPGRMKSEDFEPRIAPISQIQGRHSTHSVKSVQPVVPTHRLRRRPVASGSFRSRREDAQVEESVTTFTSKRRGDCPIPVLWRCTRKSVGRRRTTIGTTTGCRSVCIGAHLWLTSTHWSDSRIATKDEETPSPFAAVSRLRIFAPSRFKANMPELPPVAR